MEMENIPQFVRGSGGGRAWSCDRFVYFDLGWQLYGRRSSGNSGFRGGFASVHARVSVSIELGDKQLGERWHRIVRRFRIARKCGG